MYVYIEKCNGGTIKCNCLNGVLSDETQSRNCLIPIGCKISTQLPYDKQSNCILVFVCLDLINDNVREDTVSPTNG
jgi:hypothetical protein